MRIFHRGESLQWYVDLLNLKFESRANKYFWKTCTGNLSSGTTSEKRPEAGMKLFKALENTVDSAAQGEDLQVSTPKFATMSLYSLFTKLEGLYFSRRQLGNNFPSRRPHISRILGLYPFSAEPPIALPENLYIPNAHNQTTKKTQHLTRAHPTSTPGGRLLSSLLQVVKAIFPAIKQLFHFLGIIPTNHGAVFRPQALTKHLKTHFEDKMLQYNNMDQDWLLDGMDPEFLDVFINGPEPVIFADDFPVASTDSMQSTDNIPKDATSNHEIGILHQPVHFGDSFGIITSHPSHPPYQEVDPRMFDLGIDNAFSGHDHGYFIPQEDQSSDIDWHQYMNLSPTLSPVPTHGFDMDNSICSTSDGISPQSERLTTPATTPDCSPPSCPSPPAESRSAPHRFICPECRNPKVFRRRCDLNKHLKTHSKHLSCEYAQHGCPKKFSTQKDMKRHADSVHRGKKDFRCELCIQQGADGMFSGKDNLRDHQKRVHRIESN